MAVDLTERQREVLFFILDRKNWRPPTLRQIRKFMKVKSDNSVIAIIAALEKKIHRKFPFKR